MTGESDLIDLLASATVTSSAPSLEEIQRRSRQRRQRRTVLVAVAGAAMLVAGVAGLATVNRSRDGQVATVDSTVQVPSTAAPIAPPDTAVPPDSVAPRVAADAGPAILVPSGDGWQITGLENGATAPVEDQVAVATDVGPIGPMAWVRYNPDVRTLDYGDGPTTHHDTASPAGRTVRVGWSIVPEDLTAIFVVDGGSVAINAFDVSEAELLTLVDSVTVEGGRPVIDGATLPARFVVRPASADRPYGYVAYVLQGDGAPISVRAQRWMGDGSDAVRVVRHRPGLVERVANGRRAIIVPADADTDSWPTAVVVDGDWVYTVELPPPNESSPPATVDEVEALVASLVPLDAAAVMAQVPGLTDRNALLDRWEADIDVPAADLGWLRQGPPMGPADAEWHYQLLECTVVLDWAATGDGARLDQLAASREWNVTVDLAAYWEARDAQLESLGMQGADVSELLVRPPVLAAAREASTADARWATPLVEDCRWAIPLTGQRRG